MSENTMNSASTASTLAREAVAADASTGARHLPRGPHCLIYDESVNEWCDRHQGLPLGNGSLGVMFTGGAGRDVFLINHDALVTNSYRELEADASEQLPEVRRLAAEGRWEEAQEVCERMKEATGARKAANDYHPACHLVLETMLPDMAVDYWRTLELDRGVGQVRFAAGSTRFTRTYFVSAPDKVAVFRVEADTPGGIDVDLSLGRGEIHGCHLSAEARDHQLQLQGHYDDGVEFTVRVRLVAEGGTTTPQRTAYAGPGRAVEGCVEPLVSLRVRHAEALTILLAVEVSHPALGHWPGRDLEGLEPDYAALLRRHEADHRELFQRVSLRLGDEQISPPPAPAASAASAGHGRGGQSQAVADPPQTTDRLVHEGYLGHLPTRLVELIFHMGRYLTMATSRPGCRATNLQGIWNETFYPPWQSRYQLDMNLQMCYWLADMANLTECNEPLFDLLDDLVAPAARYARALYDCDGILLGVATDGINVRYISNMETQSVAGWLARHYWDHFLFTQDQQFLSQRAYPFMRQVGRFFEDFLIQGPTGEYVIVPSLSPENGPANRTVRLTRDATIDIAVAREIFGYLLEASRTLDIDESARERWREILDHLPQLPVGADGALREWADPDAADQDANRSLSHLYPLFPGAAITPEDTPELVEAAVKAIHKREACFSRDACGWSYAWLALLHARAGEGEEARASLSRLCRGFLMDNMLSSMGDRRQQGLGRPRTIGLASHIFQIEAGMGAAAAVLEMLLQSHGELLRILPALPAAWDTGSVRGVRARGGFQVDLSWRRGVLRALSITSLAGGPCRVKLCAPASGPLTLEGIPRETDDDAGEGDILAFATRAGETYTLLSEGVR